MPRRLMQATGNPAEQTVIAGNPAASRLFSEMAGRLDFPSSSANRLDCKSLAHRETGIRLFDVENQILQVAGEALRLQTGRQPLL